MSIKNKVDDIFSEFTKDIEKLFAADLVSIIAYGSALTDEFNTKKSDINMLVCLKDDRPSIIGRYNSIKKKWQKQKIMLPLFVTENYISESLDVFPIEFLNIQLHYKLLLGKDVLSNLTFNKDHIRHELERELKGKLLHLKLSFLEANCSLKMLARLIDASMHVLMPLFRGMLYLLDADYSVSKKEIIERVSDRYGLDKELLTQLFNVSQGEELPKKHIENVFDRYINNVHKMIELINNMEGRYE